MTEPFGCILNSWVRFFEQFALERFCGQLGAFREQRKRTGKEGNTRKARSRATIFFVSSIFLADTARICFVADPRLVRGTRILFWTTPTVSLPGEA